MVQVLGVDLEVGQPITLGPLSVFPLLSTARGTQTYLSSPEAFEKGLMVVRELDPPNVPYLNVENLANLPLLLVEGETLVGGSQDRTLNATVLVAANSRTKIPVSCVEEGRWEDPSEVARARSHLPGSLRATKIASLSHEDGPERWSSDQGRVWDEVDRHARRFNVHSETYALDDVQEAALGEFEALLEDVRPLPNQVGIVCAGSGSVLGLDLFDRPDTLDGYLKALVAGYRLDVDREAGPVLVGEVERFLAQVSDGHAVTGPAVGIGEEVRLDGAVTGLGLRVDGELLHLVAFPQPHSAV